MQAMNVYQVIEAMIGLIGSAVSAKYFFKMLTPRRGGRLLTAAAFIIAYIIIRKLYYWVASSYYDMPAWILLWVIVRYAAIFAVSFILFRCDISKQVFVICSAFAAGGNCVHISWCVVVSLWHGGSDILSAPMAGGGTPLSISIFLIAVFTFFYAAPLLLTLGSVPASFAGTRLLSAETLMLILPCIPSIAIDNALTVFAGNMGLSAMEVFYRSYGLFIFMVSASLLLTLVFSVRLVHQSARLHMEEKNTAILREQVKELRSRDTDGGWAEIRGMRHDMKNHISTMRYLLQSADAGNPESAAELRAYLGKMNATLDQFEFAFQTGNSVTDAVIHGQYLKAERQSIQFQSEFVYTPLMGVDVYDLAVILQNALENACEACKAVSQSSRFVSIRSRVRAEMFFVEISNSYAGRILFDRRSGLPLTSKPDASAHGFGVFNIRRAAQKHHGDIDIRLSEQDGAPVFTLTIALQRGRWPPQ